MFSIHNAQTELYNTGLQQKSQMSEMLQLMLTFVWLYSIYLFYVCIPGIYY